MLNPQLVGAHRKPAPMLDIPAEHLEVVRGGMWEVVNGDGTAGRSRLQLPGIEMGGKTGTAQVRRITGSQRGQSGDWKYRDHGLFVCFAPTANPRYAASVVIDHGLGGARAAAPVAKDVLTYLFDPAQGDAVTRRAGSDVGRDARRTDGAPQRRVRSRPGKPSSAHDLQRDHPAAAGQAAVAADFPGHGDRRLRADHRSIRPPADRSGPGR